VTFNYVLCTLRTQIPQSIRNCTHYNNNNNNNNNNPTINTQLHTSQSRTGRATSTPISTLAAAVASRRSGCAWRFESHLAWPRYRADIAAHHLAVVMALAAAVAMVVAVTLVLALAVAASVLL
jgi:hypothetical protein